MVVPAWTFTYYRENPTRSSSMPLILFPCPETYSFFKSAPLDEREGRVIQGSDELWQSLHHIPNSVLSMQHSFLDFRSGWQMGLAIPLRMESLATISFFLIFLGIVVMECPFWGLYVPVFWSVWSASVYLRKIQLMGGIFGIVPVYWHPEGNWLILLATCYLPSEAAAVQASPTVQAGVC